MEMVIATPHNIDAHHHQHASSRAKAKKIFSLETYLNFLSSHEIQNLTVDHLNKILSIHGFKKLKNRKQAEGAVLAITEPIHPGRSTVKDGFNPSSAGDKAVVTQREAIKDLKQLNWQECSVTSIRSVRPPKIQTSDRMDDVPIAEVAAKLMSLKGNKRCRSSVPQLARSLKKRASGPSKSGSGSGSSGGFSSLVPGPGIAIKVRGKKRSLKTLHNIDHAVTAIVTATDSST